jgi:hypothetical protein
MVKVFVWQHRKDSATVCAAGKKKLFVPTFRQKDLNV